MLFSRSYKMKTKVAKGEKIVSRKPVKAESWAGLGAGTAALAVKAVGSGRDKETGGGPRSREAWRGGGDSGPRFLRAVSLYLETPTLSVFLMYKAKRLIKRHLETAETHSFHVT